jgi:hypothetical protein
MNNLHSINIVIIPVEYRIFCADRNKSSLYPLYKWYISKQELWVNNPYDHKQFSRAGMGHIIDIFCPPIVNLKKYAKYHANPYLIPRNLTVEP